MRPRKPATRTVSHVVVVVAAAAAAATTAAAAAAAAAVVVVVVVVKKVRPQTSPRTFLGSRPGPRPGLRLDRSNGIWASPTCPRTCRKPVFKQVLSKFDLMEFGLYELSV